MKKIFFSITFVLFFCVYTGLATTESFYIVSDSLVALNNNEKRLDMKKFKETRTEGYCVDKINLYDYPVFRIMFPEATNFLFKNKNEMFQCCVDTVLVFFPQLENSFFDKIRSLSVAEFDKRKIKEKLTSISFFIPDKYCELTFVLEEGVRKDGIFIYEVTSPAP